MVLTGIIVVVLAACDRGSAAVDDGSAEEAFEIQLQRILEPASARFGELAVRADEVDPQEPLPADVRTQMRVVAASDRRAADAIEGLTPPPEAEELISILVESLRERAHAFVRAAGRADVTLRQLEEQGSITQAGEQLDQVLGQLREAGFLPAESHD